jgi:hypothetical protein
MNPNLENFIKDNPKLTVLGLFWAGFWRLYALIFIGAFVLAMIGKVLE